MSPFSLARPLRFGAAALVALAVIGLRADAQSGDAAVRLSATAVDLNAPAGAATMPVEILIQRWSTDAERDRVMNAILESGQAQLRNVLQKLPRIGALRTPGSVGWDLRYAGHSPGTDGRDHITILTDRPVAFWELRAGTRTVDYPFTLIDLTIGSNNRGEGKLYVGAKITPDKEDRTIVVENYDIQPVMLNNVRRDK